MESTKQNAEAIISVDNSDNRIIEVAAGLEKVASMGTTDLASREHVEILIKTAAALSEQEKAAKKNFTSIKDEFKRIAKPYTDDGKKVSCYSFDTDTKMTITQSGGGAVIDEEKLKESIIEKYGEEEGEKIWIDITDPAPRVLNESRLTSFVKSGEFDSSLVNDAVSYKAPSLVCKVSAMTKTEKKAHEDGSFNEVLVVE